MPAIPKKKKIYSETVRIRTRLSFSDLARVDLGTTFSPINSLTLVNHKLVDALRDSGFKFDALGKLLGTITWYEDWESNDRVYTQAIPVPYSSTPFEPPL